MAVERKPEVAERLLNFEQTQTNHDGADFSSNDVTPDTSRNSGYTGDSGLSSEIFSAYDPDAMDVIISTYLQTRSDLTNSASV